VNPFVYNPWGKPANGFQIGFTVPRLQEPLWWTGSGFKNLSSSRAEPEMFKTEAEADHKVRAELLLFIKKWRDDDAHLVLGWDKPTAPRVMNTPAVKAPEPTPDSFTADEVTSFLRSMSTRRGGRNRNVEFRDSRDSWFAEPDYRERLDHYVGSHYNPGPDDDPEGWDSEGWEEEYAGPLRKEVQDKLDARFGKGFLSVDIGEKGHIYVYLETKGRALLKTGAVPKDPATTVLGNLLAHLRALGWNHLTSHWQVSGDSFYGDHLLFERLYGKVVEETDGLAEKLVGLFGTEAVNGAEQAKLMAFALHQASETACPYQRALRMEQAFQVMLEKSLDVMDHLGVLSLGLDDMLRTMANDHETHLYLLQQRLSGVKVASAQGASSNPRGRLAAKYVLRRLAALAGTDTASFYVIAPEQLATIIRDGGWADMAHHLWGLHDGDVATLVPDMENVIRQHGGAVLNTGADGIWDVKAFDLEGDVAAPLSANHHVEELGYLPPYGTPEYQASKK
jgi:DNA-binding ferritin-like protein